MDEAVTLTTTMYHSGYRHCLVHDVACSWPSVVRSVDLQKFMAITCLVNPVQAELGPEYLNVTTDVMPVRYCTFAHHCFCPPGKLITSSSFCLQVCFLSFNTVLFSVRPWHLLVRVDLSTAQLAIIQERHLSLTPLAYPGCAE